MIDAIDQTSNLIERHYLYRRIASTQAPGRAGGLTGVELRQLDRLGRLLLAGGLSEAGSAAFCSLSATTVGAASSGSADCRWRARHFGDVRYRRIGDILNAALDQQALPIPAEPPRATTYAFERAAVEFFGTEVARC